VAWWSLVGSFLCSNGVEYLGCGAGLEIECSAHGVLKWGEGDGIDYVQVNFESWEVMDR